jgi:hypothetical protein
MFTQSRFTMWLPGFILVVCFFLGVSPVVNAADITVDDFSATTLPPGAGIGSLNQSGVGTTGPFPDGPNAGVLGGYRTITNQVTATGGGINANMTIQTGPQTLSYNTDSGVAGILTLLYDANGVGLFADFSGGTSLDLPFSAIDLPGLVVMATLSDGTNSFTQSSGALAAGAQTVSFPLSGFTGVDLSNVQSVKLVFDAANSQDFTLSGPGGIIIVQEIPEPASLALWGVIGIAGAWYTRRRLTKKATV